MNQRFHFHCPQCRTFTLIEHDGCSGFCLNCGASFIRHKCAGNGLSGITRDVWLLAATAASSHACPFCHQVARIAQAVSKLPGLSEGAKSFFDTVAVGALAVGVFIFIDKFFGQA